MIASGSASDSHIASNTVFAIRPETVPSAIRRTSLPSRPAPTGAASIRKPSRLRAPASSPTTQRATRRAVAGEPAAATAASK